LARKYFILLLVSFLLLPGCRVKEKWHTSTILAFDTICEINIFCSPSISKSAQEKVKKVFSEIESLFSPGADDYSSPLVLDLFQRSLRIYHDSKGCFDITVAPLSRLWGFFDKSYVVPVPEQIKTTLRLIGMEKIEERNKTLVLAPGMELDWGAIAKGCGIDLASKSLIQLGISRGFINAGGDLYCWGKNPSDQSWKVGLKHPRKSGYLGVLSITDLGAATTGDYQRYFVKDGIRYHHVFNPRTGYPAQGKQSVTVCGPEAVICDALSTALFVSKEPAIILEKYPDYGAIIVDSEGKISFLGKAYPFKAME
jgi:thiamine biosynthesis lipoprotein